MSYKANIYRQLGATNHSNGVRDKFDYYATEPRAVQLFLDTLEKENIRLNDKLWECATGENHLKNVLIDNGYDVIGTDIIDRGCVDDIVDFLELEENPYPQRDIITNPPYKYALEFTRKALDIIEWGNKVIIFVKVQFLEGKKRNKLYKEFPPKYIFIHSSRVNCARGGDFEKFTSSAVCYCWFVFEKGYKGDSIVKWIE